MFTKSVWFERRHVKDVNMGPWHLSGRGLTAHIETGIKVLRIYSPQQLLSTST